MEDKKMSSIVVRTKDLLKHANEWKDEAEAVEITINDENETIEFSGLEAGGTGALMSGYDPIKGLTQEEIDKIP